ncbi:hypothetical protein DFP72DRAFT_1043849 [Ephemerocybe angulata]|uniref:Uncharacterized protein n=1 Tax=Ephemerocybe angulata TaxID=980116 RepID=A0A8H6MBR5_9AGAR|nr:hypothetical protein DFP72DRAFT_1043849 [Tulosesus angulatus]
MHQPNNAPARRHCRLTFPVAWIPLAGTRFIPMSPTHTPNIELLGTCHRPVTSGGRALARSREFDALLFDQRPPTSRLIEANPPESLFPKDSLPRNSHVARGKDFCCVFVICFDILLVCNDRIVRCRQFHRACINYFQTKVPSPHRHPTHRIHFCRVFTIRGALTYFGHKAASWLSQIHAGDSIVIQAQSDLRTRTYSGRCSASRLQPPGAFSSLVEARKRGLASALISACTEGRSGYGTPVVRTEKRTRCRPSLRGAQTGAGDRNDSGRFPPTMNSDLGDVRGPKEGSTPKKQDVKQ